MFMRRQLIPDSRRTRVSVSCRACLCFPAVQNRPACLLGPFSHCRSAERFWQVPFLHYPFSPRCVSQCSGNQCSGKPISTLFSSVTSIWPHGVVLNLRRTPPDARPQPVLRLLRLVILLFRCRPLPVGRVRFHRRYRVAKPWSLRKSAVC